MKLVSYKTEDREHLGIFINKHIYNLNSCDKLIPDNMNEFLWGGEELMDHAKRIIEPFLPGFGVGSLQSQACFFRKVYAFKPQDLICVLGQQKPGT